jgi:DNA polymerase-3 subunit chi
MTKVDFVRLDRPERARVLCDLAEKYYLDGQRVLVITQDDNQGITLDRFMWTWKKGAFVPHVYDNGSVESHDEPVVIVSAETNPNGASVLIMGVPCSIEFIRQFRQAVDFAETFEETRREESRERFRRYREHGFDPGMC